MRDFFLLTFELLKSARVPKSIYASTDLERLAAFVLGAEKVSGPVHLTLDLTHPRRIQSLNRHYRGVDRTTDVIAFRYENPMPGQTRRATLRKAGFAGDIAINTTQAAIQAKKFGHPTRREVRLLLIHGILHLLDYTDYDARPRRKMFKRQNVLLLRWERQGLT